MSSLWKCAVALPVLLVIMGIAMKFGFAKYVRFEVVGPAPKKPTPVQVRMYGSSMHLLCIGCTSGIGEAAALAVCKKGGRVTVIGRTTPTALMNNCGERQLNFTVADLSSMQTAQNLVRNLQKAEYDTVLFTVGITCKKEKIMTSEGIEMDTAVSFLSRFVMVQELIKSRKLAASPSRKPRIFIMGFPGTPDVPQLEDFNWDSTPFDCWRAHKNGVIGNDALVMRFSRRNPSTEARESQHQSINVYGLNPGVIRTGILNDFLGTTVGWPIVMLQQLVVGLVCPSATQYAQGALLQLLVTPHIETLSGAFFNQGGEQIKPSAWLLAGPENLDKLWSQADRLAARALKF